MECNISCAATICLAITIDQFITPLWSAFSFSGPQENSLALITIKDLNSTWCCYACIGDADITTCAHSNRILVIIYLHAITIDDFIEKLLAVIACIVKIAIFTFGVEDVKCLGEAWAINAERYRTCDCWLCAPSGAACSIYCGLLPNFSIPYCNLQNSTFGIRICNEWLTVKDCARYMFCICVLVNHKSLPTHLWSHGSCNNSIWCSIGIGGNDAKAIAGAVFKPCKGNRRFCWTLDLICLEITHWVAGDLRCARICWWIKGDDCWAISDDGGSITHYLWHSDCNTHRWLTT